jgi:hypothetical protein
MAVALGVTGDGMIDRFEGVAKAADGSSQSWSDVRAAILSPGTFQDADDNRI